jgi:hypothetical protein
MHKNEPGFTFQQDNRRPHCLHIYVFSTVSERWCDALAIKITLDNYHQVHFGKIERVWRESEELKTRVYRRQALQEQW